MAKVAHVIDYSAEGFGRPRAVASLCEQISQQGHEVFILVGQAAPVPSVPGAAVRCMEELPVSAPGYPLDSSDPLHDNPQERFTEWVAEQLADIGPDIVHAHDLASLVACQGAPGLVCSVRTDIRSRIDKWLPPLMACREVICFNPSVLEALSPQLEAPVSWGMAGIHLGRVQPVNFAGDPRVVWSGRMDDNRDPAPVLQGMALLRERYPSIRLSLLGDGPLRGKLQSLALDLGLPVDFHGWVTRPLSLIAGADLALFSGSRMGFDRAPAEAMFLGTPVVVSSALAPLVQAGVLGRVAFDDSAQAFADSVDAALSDPALTSLLAERAKRFAQDNYSAKAQLEGTLQVYGDLLA